MRGGENDEIWGFSADLYHYISHLQVAVWGFIIALGVAVIALWRTTGSGRASAGLYGRRF